MKLKSYFATTLTITLLLLVAGVASYLMVGARTKAVDLKREFTASVYLRDSVSLQAVMSLQSELRAHRAVEALRFTDKASAAAEFQKQTGVELASIFDSNPMPASFTLTLVPNANVKKLQTKISRNPIVEEFAYPYAMAAEVDSGIRELSYYIVGFAVILTLAIVIILRNTVRLDVAASAQTIATAKRNRVPVSVIRQPFMLRAYSQGALAGIIASVFLFLATDGIAMAYPVPTLELNIALMCVIFAAMILTGMLLTTLFTYVALHYQIKEK